MRLLFWQNMAAAHQAELMVALAASGNEVIWVVDQLLSEDRRGQGWQVPEKSAGLSLLQASPSECGHILDRARPELCVFAPRGCRAAPTLLRELAARGIPYAFMMEAPDGRGFLLALKRAAHRLFLSRRVRPRFTLAMGHAAADFYRSAGYPRVFPFGYTVSPSALPCAERPPVPHRFIYIGRLIPLKQVDLLLKALAQAKGEWSLDIVGDGPCRPALQDLAARSGIADRIRWLGFVPNGEARRRVAESDTLVLPSEWEGWGAVVNEALAEGTRVVVSSACGSSCLAGLNPEDAVFTSGSVASLSARLADQIRRGGVGRAERERRRLVHRRVDGASMASYFSRIAGGEAPPPPWHTPA